MSERRSWYRRGRRSHARPGVERPAVNFTLVIPMPVYARARLVAARLGVSTRKFLTDVVERSVLTTEKE